MDKRYFPLFPMRAPATSFRPKANPTLHVRWVAPARATLSPSSGREPRKLEKSSSGGHERLVAASPLASKVRAAVAAGRLGDASRLVGSWHGQAPNDEPVPRNLILTLTEASGEARDATVLSELLEVLFGAEFAAFLRTGAGNHKSPIPANPDPVLWEAGAAVAASLVLAAGKVFSSSATILVLSRRLAAEAPSPNAVAACRDAAVRALRLRGEWKLCAAEASAAAAAGLPRLESSLRDAMLACGKAGQATEIIKLLDAAAVAGAASAAVFGAAMGGCGWAEDWKQVLEVSDRMAAAKVGKNGFCYKVLCAALERTNQPDRALQVLLEMRTDGATLAPKASGRANSRPPRPEHGDCEAGSSSSSSSSNGKDGGDGAGAGTVESRNDGDGNISGGSDHADTAAKETASSEGKARQSPPAWRDGDRGGSGGGSSGVGGKAMADARPATTADAYLLEAYSSVMAVLVKNDRSEESLCLFEELRSAGTLAAAAGRRP
ncbi:unnamed protein product, partial [Phaeothamnion confervicola]